jgi:hypothetical protein
VTDRRDAPLPELHDRRLALTTQQPDGSQEARSRFLDQGVQALTLNYLFFVLYLKPLHTVQLLSPEVREP